MTPFPCCTARVYRLVKRGSVLFSKVGENKNSSDQFQVDCRGKTIYFLPRLASGSQCLLLFTLRLFPSPSAFSTEVVAAAKPSILLAHKTRIIHFGAFRKLVYTTFAFVYLDECLRLLDTFVQLEIAQRIVSWWSFVRCLVAPRSFFTCSRRRLSN